MPEQTTIALDAMGADEGVEAILGGAALSLARHPSMRYLIYGDEAIIVPLLSQYADMAARSEIFHTAEVVAKEARPSQAVRRGRQSSMWLALNAVHAGEAQAAVSAGNTGALMALAKLRLGTMPEIERPAIAAIWPTVQSECIVLDVGANVSASARQLGDFALMGAAMARTMFHAERPSVGLLNIGVEEIKGADAVKQAHAWLKETDGLAIDYKGFIEGDRIGHGGADVVVVEGFAGNIALKTAEGTARQVGEYLRAAMNQSWLSKLGAFLAQGGFRVLKHKMDPRRANGGVFLGLNGIVIKSHGGTDAVGFSSAVDLAFDMSASGLVERIATDLDDFHAKIAQAVPD